MKESKRSQHFSMIVEISCSLIAKEEKLERQQRKDRMKRITDFNQVELVLAQRDLLSNQQTLQTMKTASLEVSRASSLKHQIYQTLRHTQLQSVTRLLHQTRTRTRSDHPNSSDLRPTTHSLHLHSDLSPPNHHFSPFQQPLPRIYRSTSHLNVRKQRHRPRRSLKEQSKPKSGDYSEQRGKQKRKGTRKDENKSLSRKKRFDQEQPYQKKSRSKQSLSKDRQSKLNLSSILQQESSESKLRTPSSKDDMSRLRRGRKLSNDRTKKKDRRGLKDIVWRRLEKSLREPQRYLRLVKNDIFSLKFRVLRKRLLEIVITTIKDIHNLTVTLHKGNLQCQGIQQIIPLLEINHTFNLYSSVRAVDLTQPLSLPQVQIEGFINADQRVEKVVTLPYCWLHTVEEAPPLRSSQRSRIKTKACLQQMGCSKLGLKGLVGVLPGWSGECVGRGYYIWQSRLTIGQDEFILRVIEQEGRFAGEVSGRGEQRLTRMLEFLQQLLS